MLFPQPMTITCAEFDKAMRGETALLSYSPVKRHRGDSPRA